MAHIPLHHFNLKTATELEDLVAAVFEERTLCDECKFLDCWDEHHPYGDGTAVESLCECKVKNPLDCPGGTFLSEEILRNEEDFGPELSAAARAFLSPQKKNDR